MSVAAGMALSPVTSVAAAWLSSSDHLLSRRIEAKSALVPSCLCSTVPRSYPQTALLPSSLYSLPRSFAAAFGDSKGIGFYAGPEGRFVDSRRSSGLQCMARQSQEVLDDSIRTKNSLNPVVVYSKSWCPYCSMVKALFTKLRVPVEVVELDQLVDEQDVQDALKRLTGQSTVPNVFIGGKHIGGCDNTMALHKSGELLVALQAAGVSINAA